PPIHPHPPPRSPLFPYTTLFRSSLPMTARQDAHTAVLLRSLVQGDPDAHDPRAKRNVEVGMILMPGLLPAQPRRLEQRHILKPLDRKSTRLNSSHRTISYAVFCL